MDKSLALDQASKKAFEIYLRVQKNRSPHTCRSYYKTIDSLSEFSESHSGPPEELIRDFIRNQSKNQAKSTQAQRVSALRTYIRWNPGLTNLEKEKLIKHLHSPKKQKRIPRIIERHEITEVASYIALREEPLEQLLFYLLYGSGLRISEALGLNTSQIDFKKSEITVWGKGSKQRIVPILSEVKNVIKKMNLGKKDRLFPATIHEREAREWVAKWGKDLGFEKKHGRWHPHMLRHSIASHLSQDGAKLPSIQKLLGHEQMSTTEQYTQIKVSDLLKIYKKSHKL